MTKSMLIRHRAFGPPFEGTATEAQTRVMELQLMVDRLMELQLMVDTDRLMEVHLTVDRALWQRLSC